MRERPVRIHTSARAELAEAVGFYRERGGERWGQLFKARVHEAFKAIGRNPDRYGPLRELPAVRSIRVKQFPFRIHFVAKADYVWVLAVVHNKREPGYWGKRITE